MGWRQASEQALPANIAGLVLARPKLVNMAKDCERAGLLPEGAVQRLVDRQLRDMVIKFEQTLDSHEKHKVAALLDKAAAAAESAWQKIFTGDVAATAQAPVVELNAGVDCLSAQLSPLDDEAVEQLRSIEPDVTGVAPSPSPLSSAHLQRELSILLDSTSARRLQQRLQEGCRWEQHRRLKELSCKSQSHKWLWLINPRDGAVMSEEDYIINIQKRLGAKILETETVCRQCGQLLDPEMNHCECCAQAESTKGHYAVVRALVEGLRLADSGVVTEPPGLTCTSMRPADILTNAALPGRSAALDVTVASPEATYAGTDAAESDFKRKLRKYKDLIPQLRAAGIAFRPM
eukprot:12402961-Karenia_brevis.AAC.1